MWQSLLDKNILIMVLMMAEVKNWESVNIKLFYKSLCLLLLYLNVYVIYISFEYITHGSLSSCDSWKEINFFNRPLS